MRALVTGGTKGIGLSIAKALRARGHYVVIGARWENYDPMDLRRKQLEFAKIDVSSKEKIDEFIQKSGRDFDLLVNNVGGGGTWSVRDIEMVWQNNAGAAWQFTQAMLPYMVSQGFGRVVTITSLGNLNIGFNIAKQAQTALMQTLSRRYEYVSRGVTFNCVAPGRVAVGKEDDVDEEYLKRLPSRRLTTPEEVAAVVAFLCSREASGVNGAVIKVGDVPC